MSHKHIRLIECPRDAMQGWKNFIPTSKKVEYINTLLQVGFDTIDFGSFVSPRLIPQMSDTSEVIKQLDTRNTKTKLLAIVANVRGAEEASRHDGIFYLGFPLSVSETFQQHNTNSSIGQSMVIIEKIRDICLQRRKELVIYISMAFGNPYDDLYSDNHLFTLVKKIADMGIGIISLADTVGIADPDQVASLTKHLVEALPDREIGVHLHSKTDNRLGKVDAALNAGCYRFDGALHGIGGCPMAGDELVGNMPTEWMIGHFKALDILPPLDETALSESMRLASEIFSP